MTAFGPYPGIVERVVDGDTICVALDLGFDLTFHAVVRLVGINAPEHGTTAGDAATAFLTGILPVGAKVAVWSRGWDKYGGRVDGVVSKTGIGDVASAMIASGNAKPWDGKGKRPT